MLLSEKNDIRERLTFCPNWREFDQRSVEISLISLKVIISELVCSEEKAVG